MKAFTRILGAAAAVAAGAAAVVAVRKVLGKESNTYAELAVEKAQPAEPLYKAPAEVQQAAAELSAEPVIRPISPDQPNPNPVDAGPVVTPRTADGKIDVSKLIDPADFADWDDLGCRS